MSTTGRCNAQRKRHGPARHGREVSRPSQKLQGSDGLPDGDHRQMKPLALLMLGVGIASGQPRMQNARLETRPVSGTLDATFRGIVSAQTAPAWIGYAVP